MRRRSLLEQMVSLQRRALRSLCDRVDLLQEDIDRQAGAQTDLESRLLDLETYMRTVGPLECCARCMGRRHVNVSIAGWPESNQ